MPLYTYRCPVCRRKVELFRRIEDRDLAPCCRCVANKDGHPEMMQRELDAPRVQPDLPGYRCPISGRWIEGRRQHEENLKRNNCRLIEPGEREAVDRDRQLRERQLDAEIGETVERTIHEMPVEKRDRLVAELQGGIGADVAYIRSTPERT